MKLIHIGGLALSILLVWSCASSKKRSGKDVSALSKFYHNTTAYYNGYFNADEILDITYEQMEVSHNDDFSEILSVYNYDQVDDVKSFAPELDRAIEKVVKVANLHEPSKYVDDCYVLMGEAQYLKKDYESAEETLRFFEAEFDPNNKSGRMYNAKDKKVNKRKLAEEKRELRLKEREEERKKKEAEKKAKKKDKERARKDKEREKKARQKAKKKERKAKEKERKKRKKAKKRNKGKRGSKKRKKRTKKDLDQKVDEAKEKVNEVVDKVNKSIPKIQESEVDKATMEGREGRDTSVPEEEEEVAPPSTELAQRDKTSYTKGLVWLARTYVARDDYSGAERILSRISNNGIENEDILRELPVIYADIRLKQKRYKEAIPYLMEAIDLTKKKDLRARYNYILGQIHTYNNEYDKAAQHFAVAEKNGKKFDLKFSSKLNRMKCSIQSGNTTLEEAEREFEKMLNQDKYIDQRDQIYFTLGELDVTRGDIASAEKNFSAAIAANTSNPKIKAVAYSTLANILFDREEYLRSYTYLDSTLQVAQPKTSLWTEATDKSQKLKDIVPNIVTIMESDSILAMRSMSKDEIRALAEANVEKEAKDETSKKEASMEDKVKNSKIRKNTLVANSTFPFYNASIADRGKNEFVNRWGSVRNVDNWRVAALSQNDGGDNALGDETDDDTDVEEAIEKEIVKIQSSIPYDEERAGSIERKMEVAMFTLGSRYRTNLKNFAKSAEVHEKLLNRFQQSIFKRDAYYYLYLNYKDLGKVSLADKYKNKLLSEYPESELAMLIKNPENIKKANHEQQEGDNFYQATYALYEQGNYQQVIDNAELADKNYGVSFDLKPKFDFLKAMSLGSTQGKDVYINALKNYVSKYKDTPEGIKASELLRILNGGDPTPVKVKGVGSDFVFEDGIHYFCIITYNASDKDVRGLKSKLAKYNRKYFKVDRLRVNDVMVNIEDNTTMVYVQKFENIIKALAYLEEYDRKKDEVMSGESYFSYPCIINQKNYRKILSDQSESAYAEFFNEHYR